MKILPSIVSIVHSLLFLLLGINHGSVSVDASNDPPYSETFPSLNDAVSMARLSKLVYKFKHDRNFTCADFASASGNITKDILCEWYIHDYSLGTQVLLVSNKEEKYIAVIFAGIDDIRTSLEDTNILTKEFGNNSTVSLSNIDQRYKMVTVHGGFNNAVFTDGIWDQVYARVQNLLRQHPSYSLWTTGHSLGAANAILAATAFALLNRNRRVLSINFGCPQIGNHHWRDFFNSTSPLTNNLSIWRVVLAWDLVPRLPSYFFYHSGHTIQINAKTNDLEVYYEHYGEDQHGYAGVSIYWYSKSYAWLPFALNDHHMYKCLDHLERIEPKLWVQNFYETHSNFHDDVHDDFPDDLLLPEDTAKIMVE